MVWWWCLKWCFEDVDLEVIYNGASAAQRGCWPRLGFTSPQKVSTPCFMSYHSITHLSMAYTTQWVQKDKPWCLFFQISETSPQGNTACPQYSSISALICWRWRVPEVSYRDHVPWFISHRETSPPQSTSHVPRKTLVPRQLQGYLWAGPKLTWCQGLQKIGVSYINSWHFLEGNLQLRTPMVYGPGLSWTTCLSELSILIATPIYLNATIIVSTIPIFLLKEYCKYR